MATITTVCEGVITGPTIYLNSERISPLVVERSPRVTLASGSELIHIPRMMGEYYFPIEEAGTGDDIDLRCMQNIGVVKDCIFYINIYQCPRCSSPVNGELPASLTLAGYDAGSCSPGYRHQLTGDFIHPMVTFSVPVAAGQSVSLPTLGKDLSFFAIFAATFLPCQSRASSSCAEPSICTLNGSECVVAKFCPSTGSTMRGPSARSCPTKCLVNLV